MSRWFVFVIAVATVAHAQRAAQQMPPTLTNLRLASPTYYSDGKVGGASARLTFNGLQPISGFVTSGDTLCASSSFVPDQPSDAGYGWHIAVTRQPAPPWAADGREEFVLRVEWQRRWEHGAAVANGLKGESLVTLHSKERIILDYLPAGDEQSVRGQLRVARDHEAQLKDKGYGLKSAEMISITETIGRLEKVQSCPAIGMALEVGLDPDPKAARLIETDLWLVTSGLAAGNREITQHQTVRAREGNTAEYFFDPLSFPATPAGTPNTLRLRISGDVKTDVIAGGQLQTDIMVAQSDANNRSGSSTYTFKASPDEPVGFQLLGKAFYFFNLPNQGDAFKLELRARVHVIH